MTRNSIIETKNLTKRYGRSTVVKPLTFSVEEGEIFGFLGPNGAGKTTTLLMLLGLTSPSGGTARVGGLDPLRDSLQVKRFVGYLPENVGFYGDLTAYETLLYMAELNAIPEIDRQRKISKILDDVGIADTEDKKVSEFSRGMKQRLGIAEVLLKEPRVLFLDEPTLGLDPDGARRLIDLIRNLNRDQGMTVLISSHNLGHVQQIVDSVGIMTAGEMVARGTMKELAGDTGAAGEKQYHLEEIYMKYFREV
jgi:ABC-2 type transport system ATP-binding protein